MKTFIKILIPTCILVLLIYSFRNCSKQVQVDRNETHPVIKLELLSPYGIKQLESGSDERFDLSGMVCHKGMILAVADKEWNRFIYRIEDRGMTFSCTPYLELCPVNETDLEGIDYADGRFYLAEENKSDVYEVSQNFCEMKKLEIPWDKYGIDRSGWGNKGLEAVTLDTVNSILYLAKEREPRHIFRIDLKNMEITEPFRKQLSAMAGTDITDLKFEKGFLYMLERRMGRITRINIKTGELLSASFQDYVFKNGQRLFKNSNPEYGMAEAFILKGNEIWIGLDNNGDSVSGYGKSMGLKEGNKTAILVFHRPKSF